MTEQSPKLTMNSVNQARDARAFFKQRCPCIAGMCRNAHQLPSAGIAPPLQFKSKQQHRQLRLAISFDRAIAVLQVQIVKVDRRQSVRKAADLHNRVVAAAPQAEAAGAPSRQNGRDNSWPVASRIHRHVTCRRGKAITPALFTSRSMGRSMRSIRRAKSATADRFDKSSFSNRTSDAAREATNLPDCPSALGLVTASDNHVGIGLCECNCSLETETAGCSSDYRKFSGLRWNISCGPL